MLAETFLTLLSSLTIHTAHAQVPATAPILSSLPVAKYALPNVVGPTKKDVPSLGVETSAHAAMVIDVASGSVLYEKDADSVHAVASLTKLMTAMTLLDGKPNLEDAITILAEDETSDGHSPFNNPETITKGEALEALLVGSVNAVSNAIARTSEGGREGFIKKMNEKAQSLQLHQSDFRDPAGLDERSRSSAHDIALVLRAALMYPEIRDATGKLKVEVKGQTSGKKYTIKTTNLLLSSFLNKKPYQIVAGKTGSLPQAGFCLAQATRDQEGNEVIAVVLGSENHFARFQDAKSLTYWAFTSYDWPAKTANSR